MKDMILFVFYWNLVSEILIAATYSSAGAADSTTEAATSAGAVSSVASAPSAEADSLTGATTSTAGAAFSDGALSVRISFFRRVERNSQTWFL